MFRDSESQEHFYHVALSNHETVVLATSNEEAASIGVQNILKEFGEDTNVSLVVAVTKIDEKLNDVEVISFSKVLEDVGLFSLSKKITNISDFLLDKSKKRY
tara:strand:- start:743 stop:1048 length:306 start_codon:yes stop_codon:yes gene_type:complete